MPDLKKKLLLLPTLLLVGMLTACGGGPKEINPELGAAKLYQKARQSIRSGNYRSAIMLFERLEAHFPFSDHTRQAQLDIIYAYYINQEPDAAIDAADQFILENPIHPRVDYANYIKGMAYFPRTPGKFSRWFKMDPTERPPHDAQRAFDSFHYLVSNFPDSPYTANARQRMIFLNEYLAEYQMHVARYYMDRGAYVATLKRAENVLIDYQGTPSVADALNIMITAYEKLGLDDMAKQTRDVYRLNFSYQVGDPVQSAAMAD